MLWKRSLHVTALLCFTCCFGQTQLKEGDIRIIGLDCESEDFMFVTFVPLEAGTEIYFTDEEADGSYQIGAGEGTVLYTAPAGGLNRGTVVSFQSNAADFSVTSDGMIALANSGDGLIAYQGIQVGEVTLFLDALGSFVSSLGTFPGGFGGRVLGTVNGQYQGLRNGSNQTSYLVRIDDLSDWQLADSSLMSFDLSSFSFDTSPILFSNSYELPDLGYQFHETAIINSISVQGVHLNSEVQITASANYEIALDENGVFGSSLTLNPIMGSLSPTLIYVRLKPDLNFGTYFGDIQITSGLAQAREVALIGASKMGYNSYCTDLFISEYIEGTSNNKFVELYNPTINEIVLTGSYQLELYNNGSTTTSGLIPLVGTVQAHGVFVIEHPLEALNVSADQQSGILNFNGNDALVLRKAGEVIDVFGQVGFDPGVNWTGNSCVAGTQDSGLRRKSFVQNGNKIISEPFVIDEQWQCTALNDVSNLGIHTIDNPSKLTIWSGSSWSSGVPDSNDVALINGDYSTNMNGFLESCMLYVSQNATVEIADLDFVILEGDAVVRGNLFVHSSGSFVQKNNSSQFKLSGFGTAQLQKQTSFLSRWYEYTYWSSPVTSIPIETALNNSPANRRFYFNAANYEDLLAEMGNTGVYNPGSDGIDDNGDDWQRAQGIMVPGRGYAATMHPSGFIPGNYTALFTGAFNNGVVEIPVVSNSGGAYSDWNFLGNPYPGGLEVSQFLKQNSDLLSGAIYLWSHDSEPLSTNPGNEAQNFSNSDYAIITGSGVNVAGGDGIIPESYIPSAQGFFIEAKNNGNVVFNNSMRAVHALSNNQFFKNSKKTLAKETNQVLWLNLTTESGAFSQIAIGFSRGATDGDDGSYYDVQRKYNQSAGAIMYSVIEGADTKFAIQSRGARNLKGQMIPLEIVSNFTSETEFSIELAKKKGSLIARAPIYIFDKTSQTYVDLQQEVFKIKLKKGTAKDRFELRFKKPKINPSTATVTPKSRVLIEQNGEGGLRFVPPGNKRVREVEIFDVLGRRMYHFKHMQPMEYYNISKITGFFLSKIRLENDEVIVQKSFRKSP